MTDKITVREAARRCGRNPETIRRWIWDGKLAAEKIGNQLFVEPNHLVALAGARAGRTPEETEALFAEIRALAEDMHRSRGGKDLEDIDWVARGRAERSAELWRASGLPVPEDLKPEDRIAFAQVEAEDAGWVYADGGVWRPSSPKSIAEQLAVLEDIRAMVDEMRESGGGDDLEDIDWVERGRDDRMAELTEGFESLHDGRT